jgi:hypothetical protein
MSKRKKKYGTDPKRAKEYIPSNPLLLALKINLHLMEARGEIIWHDDGHIEVLKPKADKSRNWRKEKAAAELEAAIQLNKVKRADAHLKAEKEPKKRKKNK